LQSALNNKNPYYEHTDVESLDKHASEKADYHEGEETQAEAE
jgi:hypothetical protein